MTRRSPSFCTTTVAPGSTRALRILDGSLNASADHLRRGCAAAQNDETEREGCKGCGAAHKTGHGFLRERREARSSPDYRRAGRVVKGETGRRSRARQARMTPERRARRPPRFCILNDMYVY